MNSACTALSPSTPFLKRNPNPNTNKFRFNPIVRLSNSPSLDLATSINGFSSRPSRSSPLCSTSGGFSNWISLPSLVSRRSDKDDELKVSATAGESAGETDKSTSLAQTLQLGSLFGLWYLFNIYFNLYNKQVLKVFPFPVTITTFQFAIGTTLVLFMWTFNLHKRPKITSAQLVAILPLAIVHTMGNLFTNMSLGKVAVSFTHTIKAMEPFFSVLLSAMFLGEKSMDNITLFSVITIMSLFLLTPVALFMEGVKFTPTYLQTAGLNVKDVCIKALVAGICFHAYQQVSYMILQRVSPVTHSVGNCVKRVVVIVSSVLFFRSTVTPINSLGTGIALAGVFLYSRVKQLKPKPKSA
ncbi:hypothetical protein GIB67_004354 [Kingdonia uniflora]|uniref:Sugar phosphate transporter domain-containing protein n=1 Tax=Kingdonia uniflora TaxID=39325 RepID=A0A7J7MRA6_9MAGN|nr:hypothetical protein GIB67_004354 [Kingdonia uniflora]